MARRTHCPQGRPLYRVDEIPAHLATVTMLRLQRRYPAPGQKPAATLLYHGNQHTELYEIAATEQLPALPPGRLAAYLAARTCARCATQRDKPWPRDVLSGRRVCPPCAEAEAESSWRAERNAARAAAVAWARGALADPSAVLLHVRSIGLLLGAAYVAELSTGAVLLDAPRLRHNEPDFAACPPTSWADNTVGIADIADQVRALAGRRIIAWSAYHHGPHGLIWNMRTLGEDLEQQLTVAKRPRRREPGGDELGDWYSDWIGERASPGGSWRYHRDVRSLSLAGPAADPDAAGAVRHMRTLLAWMAVDDHPAGPPACPALDPGSRQLCGATDLIEGLCRAHLVSRIREAAHA